MSIATVLVSGQLYTPAGTPAANAEVRFSLSGPGIVGLSLLVPRFAATQCDATGAFALQLVPSPAGTHYTVRAGWDGALLLSVRAVVPANDCQLSQIMDALPVPSLSAAEQALIDLQAALAQINAIRQEVIDLGAAGGGSSLDGGAPDSVYTTSTIDGGTP